MKEGDKPKVQHTTQKAETCQEVAELKTSQTDRNRLEEALRKSTATYSTLVECARDGIVVVQDGIHRFANSAMSDISGYEREEILGMPFLNMVMPEFRELVASRAALRTGRKKVPPFYEVKIICKYGAVKDVQLAISVIDFEGRRAVMAIVRDATDRKQAEEALRQSEERFRSIYTESPIAIEIYESDGRRIGVNRAWQHMFGLEDTVKPVWPSLFDDPYVSDEAKSRLRNGEVVRYELPFSFDDAKRLGLYKGTRSGIAYLDVVINPFGMREEKGVAGGYMIQSQEITAHKWAEYALRQLSHQLVEIQEMERRHLAHELHDQIGQSLTGLKLLLVMAMRSQIKNIRPVLEEAQDLINELMGRVEALSLDLRPLMLDDFGLLPTLLWHFERYTAQTGIRVIFDHNGLQRRFASDLETAVYRIVQEALTNVARHAKVHEVTVQLLVTESLLIARIEDHGSGFDRDSALVSGTSVGLFGMRERAVSLGGKLTLDSAPGGGTCIFAELPIGGSEEEQDKAG